MIDVPNYPHETGVENYKEFWQSQVALSGESQNFDGNGGYTRFQPGGGTQTLSTGDRRASAARRCSPTRTCRRSARFRSTRRASRRTGATSSATRTRCRRSTRTRSGGRPAHEARDPKAPARLHRDPLPGRRGGRRRPATSCPTSASTCRRGCPGSAATSTRWRPSSRPARRSCRARASRSTSPASRSATSARSSSRTACAVVELKIQDKYKPIYRDAKMLLRPKTGLKDMFVELDPGTQAAGELPEGGRIRPGADAARREPGRDPGAARRRHARLPADPRQRRRRGVHRRPVEAVHAVLRGRPARDVQALRADERVHREVHRAPVRAAPEREARDPQLQPARRRSSARRTRSSPSWSTPRTRTSRCSPSRRRTCGARSSSCRRR